MAGSSGPDWTSTLTVAEMALLRRTGFEPCGTVMGTSVYRLGTDYPPVTYAPSASTSSRSTSALAYQSGTGSSRRVVPSATSGYVRYYGPDGRPINRSGSVYSGYRGAAPWGQNWERRVHEEGMERAAKQAIAHLVGETRALGGHGVVATRLRFARFSDLPSTVGFNAIGTALTRTGAGPLVSPFTSHFSGQDFYKLISAGMVPVTLAVGVGSVRSRAAWVSMLGAAPVEVLPFSDAIEASVRIAASRAGRSRWGGGEALLAQRVSFEMEREEAASRTMTTVVLGTVVRRFHADRPAGEPLPILRLSRP